MVAPAERQCCESSDIMEQIEMTSVKRRVVTTAPRAILFRSMFRDELRNAYHHRFRDHGTRGSPQSAERMDMQRGACSSKRTASGRL